ncbi:MAG: VCBS repeat-containing protein [candidate division WOR-3 bacterium]|nr:VCBS repeat-containing protein [candidate division WOR-3 bacterium]MDW8113967.1 VCBS repeat-containing protein [candidate division WOR-3 bacterium]
MIISFIFILSLINLEYQESSNGLIPPTLEIGRLEIEMVDINQDGNLDLISIGDHGSPYVNTDQHGIMVWFGDGRGNWQVYMNGNFGYGGIAYGDVNNDGFLDVGYGMHHNYSRNDFGDQLLEVALGDGTGRNWIPWDDSLATHGQDWGMFCVDFADVNNDGLLDIGSNAFGYDDGIHIYLNLGNGVWRRVFGFIGGYSGHGFVFGDINKDGNVDFAVAHQYGSVYFGDGTGNFILAHRNLPSLGARGFNNVALNDVDNDGGMDLGFINPQGGIQVWIFNEEGDSWQNFSGNLPSTGSYERIQLFDMNLDGFIDVIAQGNGILKIYLGNGNGNWQEIITINTPSPGTGRELKVGGDCDHNGYPDIILVAGEGSPNARNRARFFKETSIPSNINIYPVFPRGYERFQPNSVNFIKWLSAIPNHPEIPSYIKIQFSSDGPNGPFITVVDSFPNTGFFQWRIPNVIRNNCYLKLTIFTPNDTASVITPHPFAIGMVSAFKDSENFKEKIKEKIFDLTGREIKGKKLKKGIYFIKKKTKIKKLIIF